MSLRDGPTATALLATARRTLLDDLLPLLPEERRYEALLVALAMRIAISENDAGDGWLRQVGDDLARLYDEGRASLDAADVARLYRRFAADLRAGAFDTAGARTDIAHGILRAVAHHKLLENNPKYARSREGDG